MPDIVPGSRGGHSERDRNIKMSKTLPLPSRNPHCAGEDSQSSGTDTPCCGAKEEADSLAGVGEVAGRTYNYRCYNLNYILREEK